MSSDDEELCLDLTRLRDRMRTELLATPTIVAGAYNAVTDEDRRRVTGALVAELDAIITAWWGQT